MEYRIALWIALLFILIVMLVGCAAVPPCDKPSADVFSYEGKNYALFDQENITKLGLMMKGLRDGTCK